LQGGYVSETIDAVLDGNDRGVHELDRECSQLFCYGLHGLRLECGTDHSGDPSTRVTGHLRDPRPVTCAESAWALLRPVYPTSPVPKPQELRVTLHYGELALHFTSAPRRVDSLCTLVSQRGALPVITDLKAGSGAGLTDASQQIAASVTTAILDIIPTRTGIRRCNFSLMESLGRAALADPTKPLPHGTNECYLNETDGGLTNGLTVRWSIPGFDEYAPDEHGVQVYKTQALTYYIDLNSLLATRDVNLIDSAVIDFLENYIHRTVIKNLPAITPIGLAQVVLGT
jgi:hypothetical protein